jgi:hypothetical protein
VLSRAFDFDPGQAGEAVMGVVAKADNKQRPDEVSCGYRACFRWCSFCSLHTRATIPFVPLDSLPGNS